VFIVDLDSYEGDCRNLRVEGFRILKKGGLRIPEPLKIVTHEAFLEYCKNGLTEALREEISNVFAELMVQSKDIGVAVRRVYFDGFAGVNLGLPARIGTSTVTSANLAADTIRRIFDYAVKVKFAPDPLKLNRVMAIMHPFINPKVRGNTAMYGGTITTYSLPQNKKRIILIQALYGNDEGAQKLPHDKYIVDDEYLEVERKDPEISEVRRRVIVKTLCFQSKVGSGYLQKVKVPSIFQKSSVMKNEDIIELARAINKLAFRYGDYRYEFNQIEEGVYFTECASYDKNFFLLLNQVCLESLYRLPDTAPLLTNKYEGFVKKILNPNQVNNLSNEKIIYISTFLEASKLRRLSDEFAKGAPKGSVVLIPTTGTAHPIESIVRALGEGRIAAIVDTGGRTKISDGDYLRITLPRNSIPSIEVAGLTLQFNDEVIPLDWFQLPWDTESKKRVIHVTFKSDRIASNIIRDFGFSGKTLLVKIDKNKQQEFMEKYRYAVKELEGKLGIYGISVYMDYV